MQFTVKVVEPEEMQAWYDQAKLASPLDDATYQLLLKPSMANPPSYYSNVPANFLDKVIAVYTHTFGPNHPRHDAPADV